MLSHTEKCEKGVSLGDRGVSYAQVIVYRDCDMYMYMRYVYYIYLYIHISIYIYLCSTFRHIYSIHVYRYIHI